MTYLFGKPLLLNKAYFQSIEMSYQFEGLRSGISGRETFEVSLRQSNALEVEARNRLFEIGKGLKQFESIVQVLI